MIKNAGKVAANVVSLTEYGFEKIQNLTNNGEMIDFIHRVCEKHGFNVLSAEITKLAWKFSGDTNNGKKEGVWKYYRKNGIIKAEECWQKNNVEMLLWEKYYNRLGLLESELIYRNGSLAEERYYNESGKVFKTNNYMDNN